MLWFTVAVGGALGSVARHLVNHVLLARAASLGIPVGTLAVNVVGCFAIGLLGGLGAARQGLNEPVRTFVVVGLLGGFTTFSSFGLETVLLARGGLPGLALANVLGHVVLGLAAVTAGFWLGGGRP